MADDELPDEPGHPQRGAAGPVRPRRRGHRRAPAPADARGRPAGLGRRRGPAAAGRRLAPRRRCGRGAHPLHRGLRGRLVGAGRERQPGPARAGRPAHVAAGRRRARARALPAAGGAGVLPRLRRQLPAGRRRHHPARRPPLRGAVRADATGPRGRAGRTRRRARGGDSWRAGRCREPGRRPDPACPAVRRAGRRAHQRLPGRAGRTAPPLPLVQALAAAGGGDARTRAARGGLGVLPARGGRAPAVR